MGKNEKNLGSFGAPPFDSDYPAAPFQPDQQGGFQGGFPQGGFGPGMQGMQMPGGPMGGFGPGMQGMQMPGGPMGGFPGQMPGGPGMMPGGPGMGGMMPGGPMGGMMPGGPMGGFPGQMQGAPQVPSGGPFPGAAAPPGAFEEESYIENILRLNRGKLATVYMTFENNSQWNAKVFKGIVEAAGRDHIVLSDPQTGRRYLLLMVYLDYVTFDEELNYEYPFA